MTLTIEQKAEAFDALVYFLQISDSKITIKHRGCDSIWTGEDDIYIPEAIQIEGAGIDEEEEGEECDKALHAVLVAKYRQIKEAQAKAHAEKRAKIEENKRIREEGAARSHAALMEADRKYRERRAEYE